MMKALLSLALLVGGNAVANELDNEGSVTNQALRGTVVVRVDKRDKSVSILRTGEKMTSKAKAQTVAKTGKFSKMPSSKVTNELDRDGGASSWYWYCSPYSYNNNYLYWYGNTYNSYYSYNYGYYSYYYYNRWNGGYGW